MQLTIQSGPRAGETIDVTGEQLVLGRGAECDVVLDDERVSRRHATLEQQADGSYAVRDLGSSNGTFVNGIRITAATPLRGGEELRVGDTALRVSPVEGATVVAGTPPTVQQAGPAPTVARAAPPPPPPPPVAEPTPFAPSPGEPPPGFFKRNGKWIAVGIVALAMAGLGAGLAIAFTGGNSEAAATTGKAVPTVGATQTVSTVGEITVPPVMTATTTVTVTVPTSPATTAAPPPTSPETTPTEPSTTGEGGSDPEAALLAHIPGDIQSSCQPQSQLNPPGVVVSVVCDSPDGQEKVVYWQFDSVDSMQAWYAGFVNDTGAQPNAGDCVADILAEEKWNAENETAGRLLCAPVTDKSLRTIAWTYDSLEIGSFAVARGVDHATRSRLYKFWQNAGPNP